MDGQPDPFEVFYQKHFRWVIHRAALMVGEREAEDVAQDVFLSAAQAFARGDFDISTSAWAWLQTSTLRASRDHLRRVLREQPAAQEEDIKPMDETMRGDPERALWVQQQWDELLELLHTLPAERRLVWVLSEIDQMSLATIAEALELPLGTATTRLRLAHEDLDAALARKHAEEKWKQRKSGAILLLPLSAEALLRSLKTLPLPEVPADAPLRVWKRIQEKLARPEEEEGSAPSPGVPPPPLPGAIGPRLKSEASRSTAIVLGTVVGVLAAAALADTHAGRRVTVDPPREQAASTPLVVAPPAVVASAVIAPAASASSPPAPPGPVSTPLAEQVLVEAIVKALDPSDPDLKEALHLLELYGRRYPKSRTYTETIGRMRREAQRLARQK